ncbi:MAG: SAM-dependent methyltransferase [Candidatus Latescibacterota bacterium]|nr:MAG: SAM-dependent methyltransferase [Candidatus Latescibacterota bacterium]
MPRIEPFEKYSDAYDEWFNKNPDMYRVELEAVRQLVPSSKARGVEIGVGSGRFAVPLGIEIGVEPSRKMAIKAIKQGVKIVTGVAENLPFSKSAFDFALMVTTVCFVDDVVKSFREVFRILKPNGHIIVGFIDRESELGRRYIAKRDESKFYKEATFFSAQEVLQFLKQTGFRDITIRQTLISGLSQQAILHGFGKGAFVVIRGAKN